MTFWTNFNKFQLQRNLPSKIWSGSFLRLLRMLQTPRTKVRTPRTKVRTTRTVIQTFGAKTSVAVLVFLLRLRERGQGGGHQLRLLKDDRSKATRSTGRWRTLPAKHGRSRSGSGGVWPPKASGYPESGGAAFSCRMKPFLGSGSVTFGRNFGRILRKGVWTHWVRSESKDRGCGEMFQWYSHLHKKRFLSLKLDKNTKCKDILRKPYRTYRIPKLTNLNLE
jgi:hypothetical protein